MDEEIANSMLWTCMLTIAAVIVAMFITASLNNPALTEIVFLIGGTTGTICVITIMIFSVNYPNNKCSCKCCCTCNNGNEKDNSRYVSNDEIRKFINEHRQHIRLLDDK